MMKPARRQVMIGAMLASAGLARPAQAQAAQIVVSNYAVSTNGMPYAVALEKGFFREERGDVSGIITSAGGGTTLRNMIAGGVPYAEVNPTVAIAAIQQGLDLIMISDNVLTVAEFVWATRADSPIRSMADMRGRKIGFTNPRSTSQALANMLVQQAGLPQGSVELVRTGGFGEGMAALERGIADAVPLPEPLWSQHGSKYRVIASASELLPPLANVIGVTTRNMAETRGDFIRGVIRARRRAVTFMHENPDEAGDIVARVYNIPPQVGKTVVRNLTTSRTQGIPYWGSGQFEMAGLVRMVELQKSVGALTGEVDLAKMIDTSFLPEDIRALA
ncbi:ABC transporter substrate-binding protein [Elioraea sp.]|uniref:ABC transporter substrate-binding protein n=1 Tax=Elioraea sp. TaxID=2185103 RepID=UPI0025B9398D|nr:ABC transporter substrate-binding protein [Elioraea sp.]